MKVCVIISNDQWRATAGVRIRYMRLQPALEQNGHSLELKPIGEFTSARSVDADVYVFSKTHDIRSVLLARMLRAEGRRVGIDLFDDYYSQGEDSRFVHLRRWFRTMLPLLDFAMCSTTKMSQRLARLAPDLPYQIVNDPFGSFDEFSVTRGIARNAEAARREKRLRIGWFGIGDNPHFSLGLDDLFAFSDELLGGRRLGYEVELEILTNPRALTAQRMEMLARLPVPFTLDHWSEEREAALIARSVACFLPVNAQGFSVVKSLNRGVTTLTGGSQILSAGFPLYDLLDDFVYRDIETLIADIESNRLRLRRETMSGLSDLMARYGTAAHEADTLVAFLKGILAQDRKTAPDSDRAMIVVHGLTPVGDLHKAIKLFGALSVAAPQTRRILNFDLAITPGDGRDGLEVLLSEQAWVALRHVWRLKTEVAGKLNGKEIIYKLVLRDLDLPLGGAVTPVTMPLRPLSEMGRYTSEMARMRELLMLLFPEPEVFLAESQSPYCGPLGAELAPGTALGPAAGTAGRPEQLQEQQ